MIAVIFEVWPAQGRKDDYLGIAAALACRSRSHRWIHFGRAFPKSVRPGKAVIAFLLAG